MKVSVVEHMKTSELANQNGMQIHAVCYATGTPNDGFLLNTLTALLRLSRVLLELYQGILISVSNAIKFVSVRSS